MKTTIIVWLLTVVVLNLLLQTLIMPIMKNAGFVPFLTVVLIVGYIVTSLADRLITHLNRNKQA